MTDHRLDMAFDGVADTRGAETVPTASRWQRSEPLLLGLLGILVILLLWEAVPYVVTMKAGTKLFFTPPSQVAETLWTLFAEGTIWAPLGVSAAGFAIGLGIAIAIALPLGILI